MKIAISGKGGTGKTTLAGTMARDLARRGFRVTAIDVDPQPALATTLGVDLATAREARTLPRHLLTTVTGAGGRPEQRLAIPVDEVVARVGVAGPDGVTLVIANRIEHAAQGCNCGTHSAVRVILGELRSTARDVVLVDMEAGIEHFSRSGGTLAHADALVCMLEPFYKSLYTGRRVAALAEELGIPRRFAVASKVRSAADLDAIREFCVTCGLTLIGSVPWDDGVADAERLRRAPLDHDPSAPAVAAAREVVDALLARMGTAPPAAARPKGARTARPDTCCVEDPEAAMVDTCCVEDPEAAMVDTCCVEDPEAAMALPGGTVAGAR